MATTPNNHHRFGENAAQIGGFVLSPDGRLETLRWTPPQPPLPLPAAVTNVIHYRIPTRSRPLLTPFIEQTMRSPPLAGITVLVIRQPDDGNRCILGVFDVSAFDESASTIELTRRVQCPTTTIVDAPKTTAVKKKEEEEEDAVTVTDTDAIAVTVTEERPSSSSSLLSSPYSTSSSLSSVLLERYAALWSEWTLDAVWRDDDSTTSLSSFPFTFPAVAVLFNILLPTAVEWCSAANRYGSTCVVWDVGAEYPERGPFAAAKGCAILHRIPVILCYGVPDVTATGSFEKNYGIQVVLFRPLTGDSTRAHFRQQRVTGTTDVVALAIGELSDE
jgi:hypothetical protein